MFQELINKIRQDKKNLEKFQGAFTEKKIPAKTILLNEGEVSGHLYYIREGCLRMWFNKDGKDITFQFFFEGQGVSSIDSFVSKEPSMFIIESIEPSTIVAVSREDFNRIGEVYPEFNELFQKLIFQRFRNYAMLFLSRIKDTPRERYEDLLKNHPEIIKRVTQHYIASYLGITPISLSRIRNKT